MTNTEIALNNLAEITTTEILKNEQSKGFVSNAKATIKGRSVAGKEK